MVIICKCEMHQFVYIKFIPAYLFAFSLLGDSCLVEILLFKTFFLVYSYTISSSNINQLHILFALKYLEQC